MHRRRLVVLLALSIVLLVLSNIDPSDLRQGIGSAFAGFIPGANPAEQPMAVLGPFKVFLPLIRKDPPPAPPAPAMTTSRYVTTTDPQKLNDEGCSQGQAGQNGIVVLFFGKPWYDSTTGHYGAKLPTVAEDFVSTDTIWSLVSEFANGYYTCSPANASLRLAIGTNNYGSYVNQANGIAWGQLVANVKATINEPPTMGDKISVAGAINAELQWNTPTNTRAWVDGYTMGVGYGYLYNVGNCPGCNYPTGAPGLPWTWYEVWYISVGAPFNLPLPMIYAKDGIHATQWHSMSVYAFEEHGGDAGGGMPFRGAFTQYDACHDPSNIPAGPDCIRDGLDNTPPEGWTQLYRAQNADERTAQSLDWSTDVTWKK